MRRTLILVAASVVLLAGCATSRSTIDVQGSATGVQQTTAKAVVLITGVTDKRRFEAAPRDPSTPSLEDPGQIQNRAVTSRAVGRKRGGFGMAFANVMLPEGRTVERVAREALVKALDEQGYAVVDANSKDAAGAIPLDVDIDQFWAWFTPGAFQVQVEFRAVLTLKSEPLTGQKEAIARGYALLKGMAATDTEWRDAVVKGVTDLIANLRTVIRPAP